MGGVTGGEIANRSKRGKWAEKIMVPERWVRSGQRANKDRSRHGGGGGGDDAGHSGSGHFISREVGFEAALSIEGTGEAGVSPAGKVIEGKDPIEKKMVGR